MKEIKTSKSLNRAFLALQSFKRAKALLPLVRMQTDENAKSALYGALCVYYAKPFTQSNLIGSISREEVPAKYQDTHDELILYRHKVAAHSNGAHAIQNETINCVYFIHDENGLTGEELYPYPNEKFCNNIEMLLTEMEDSASKVIKTCMVTGPPSKMKFENGRYKLSLEKDNTWFIKE